MGTPRTKTVDPFRYGGPRELIPTDTPEWAWRTIQRLKSVWASVEDDERQVAAVIEEIEAARAYERWPEDRPYGSLPALVEGELGVSLGDVWGRIAESANGRVRAAADRTDPANVLPDGGSVAAQFAHLAQRNRAGAAGVSRRTQQKLDRLAREHDDLFRKVQAGELSVNAAAIAAGFVAPTWTVPTEPVALARAIRKRLSPDDLAALRAALEGGVGGWRGDGT